MIESLPPTLPRDEGGSADPAVPVGTTVPSTPSRSASRAGAHRWVPAAFGIVGVLALASRWFLGDSLAAGLVELFAGLLAVVAVVAGVRLHRPARAGYWMLLAAGLGLWSTGGVLLGLDLSGSAALSGGIAPLSVVGSLVVLVALLSLVRSRRLRDTPGLLLNAAVLTGLLLLAWSLLSDEIVRGYGTGGGRALFGLLLVGDIVVIALAAGMMSTPGRHRHPLGWLLAGGLLRAGAHVVPALTRGLPADRMAVSLLLMASALAVGAAALSPTMTQVSRIAGLPRRQAGRLEIAAVIFAMLVPVGVLALQQIVGTRLTVWPAVAASGLMFVFVSARVVEAMGQIKSANAEREHAQQELAHQAAHDSLTGLPNRATAMQLIRGALNRAQRSGAPVGLLFVDLDGFKIINDSLGHGAGDEVLRTVAERMQAEVRAGDVVGRLGGDEFIVLLEPLDTDASAVAAADRLVAAISAPITLGSGRQIGVGASIGVAVSQDGSTDPESLLHEADVAVYRAKATGRGHSEVFDSSLRRELKLRTEIESGVVAAIENDELVVHYQPVVNVLTGDVLGFEALVRWRRPDGNLVPPGDFILVAEQSDLICELDCWVLDRATLQLARWNAELGRTNLFMAVNVSGRHIVRPRLLEDVATALAASGIEPRQLVLEITETALIDDTLALTNLETLRRRGISISIDDFGSGYNSIARLEQLPVDIVKIDSRFLDRGGPSTNKLLRLIVQAAHAFGLPVVAEGVEHPYQLELLQSIECESAQGYLLGRPVDPSEVVLGDAVRVGSH